jgi:hypothetical protein
MALYWSDAELLAIVTLKHPGEVQFQHFMVSAPPAAAVKSHHPSSRDKLLDDY